MDIKEDSKNSLSVEEGFQSPEPKVDDHGLHLVQRGGELGESEIDDTSIQGFESDRMKARTLLTADEEKKLLRRIDWRIMPLCSLMFLLKQLDALNISNARIMNEGTPRNIMTQLGLSSNAYALLTVLYYRVPYIVFEAPSNLLLKKMRPSVWQARIIVSWGLCVACQVACTSKAGIYTARFFQGLCEAGMFPGVILQMCYWYRPDEMSIRLLIFYIMGNLAGVFSGLFAYAFDTVSGAQGLSGWQWLFLFEGLITIVFSGVIYWLLPDFPPTARWLSEKEKAFVQARLPPNAPRASEANFKFREVLNDLKDVRLWMFTAIWALQTVATQGITFYQSTVIADLGFTTIAQAQLLNLPISILGIVLIAVSGYLADSARLPRPVYPLTFLSVILVCYGVLFAYPNIGGVYAATLIANAMAAAWFPLMWPWRVQTTKQATGSAFSISFVNSYGQLGGAIGPQIFRSQYAPRYHVPFGIVMGLVAACIMMTSATWYVTRHTEAETRRLKLARKKADKEGMAVLDDVVDNDLQGKLKRED